MESADAFEFYPCLVDGAPASIFVNLKFESEHPAGADTLYRLVIHMRDAADHGIGTAEEAEALFAFEDSCIASLATSGLVYVGRVRGRGVWDIAFYGPAGHEPAMRAAAKQLADRRVDARVQPDADWQFYVELLLPDAERLQWMDDRRLVQILGEQGDSLVTPRRVDHWAYFADAAARDAFVAAIAGDGFELADASHDDEGPRPFGAQVFRTDKIELDHIHDVVMKLVDAAERCGGEYDGWESPIEK